jgi:hypothetical protein
MTGDDSARAVPLGYQQEAAALEQEARLHRITSSPPREQAAKPLQTGAMPPERQPHPHPTEPVGTSSDAILTTLQAIEQRLTTIEQTIQRPIRAIEALSELIAERQERRIEEATRRQIEMLEFRANRYAEAIEAATRSFQKVETHASTILSEADTRLEATERRVERMLAHATKQVELLTDNSVQQTSALATQAKIGIEEWKAEARRSAKRIRTKLLVQSTIASVLTALALIGLLSWLRPGWTMTQQQQEDLILGRDVRKRYLRAPEPDRTEFRRLMQWQDP